MACCQLFMTLLLNMLVTAHDSTMKDPIDRETEAEEGKFPSPEVPALLCNELATKELCMPASCSHIAAHCIFDISPVIRNLSSDT